MLIDVQISPDTMEAVAQVRREGDEPLGVDAIKIALSEAKVSYGIDDVACNALVAEINELPVGRPVERRVAHGLPPTVGEDGHFEMAVEYLRDSAGQADDPEKIDFHEQGAYTAIAKDDLIATIVGPGGGTPGRDVRDREVQAETGKAASIVAGQGTVLAEGGTELRATRSGDLRCTDDKIEVSDVIRVSGNLDFETGNIECEGEVRVAGDVLPGFHIRARGDVTIGGLVESAEVESQGTVMVRHGAVRESRIKAASIVIGYVIGSYLESEGDIRIHTEAVQSTIVSGGSIAIPGSGRAVGGKLQARNVIDIGVAGSAQGGDHLALAVGVVPLKDLEAAKLSIKARRAEMAKARLENVRDMTESENESALDKMLLHQVAKAAESEAELAELIKNAGVNLSDCHIRIGRKMYFGVQLQIGRSKLTINEDRNGGTFRYDVETDQVIGVVGPGDKK